MYTILLLTIAVTCLNPLSDGSSINANNFIGKKLLKESNEVLHHPDAGLDIVQFLEKYGYPLESHEVVTEDGYILTLHRIPHARNEPNGNVGSKKPAIFVMHGLFCSSIDMINLGPGKSIGLMLVDEGYDVWLGNTRGNTWSRKHATLNPDVDKEFWDFSFDEAGYYDLPASIDYILTITGHDKLSYLGHSQGTTEFFTMATLRPEYNEKVTVMVALAPVSYMKEVTQPLLKLAVDNLSTFSLLADLLNIGEFFPHAGLFPDLAKTLCEDSSKSQELCAGFIFFLVGLDSPQLDRSFIEVIISNTPAGGSVKILKHYGQIIKSGYFRRFNYRPSKNLKMYKQYSPPDYDLSLLTTPIALYYAGNDLLFPTVNVEQLAEELPNVVEKRLIDYFNHLDLIWAKDVGSILNEDIIKVLNKYNNMQSCC